MNQVFSRAAGRPGRLVLAAVIVASLLLAALTLRTDRARAAPCDAPIQNPIVCENSLPGDPASQWDVAGAGSSSIQGFATDFSVDAGQTARFKIDTPSNDYRLDIYRMGYYGGDGARRVDTIQPSAQLPQSQPSCLNQSSTGLVDCGNWANSASWNVPAAAVSGIYFAKAVREDGGGGASHIVFIVRDDDGESDLLFQTADTTWQAYNRYGGNSLYTGSPAGRAYKVSYNRPFTTRDYAAEDWLFNSEYPMVRWLEANGYDVSYFSGIDTDRLGGELLEHEAFLSVGHDEYWSGGQRANVEAARGAGVDLGFFSGNEVFWKTRWENSIDGSGTSHRTLVSYKETKANAKIDPSPEWTGTWRDSRPFNPEGPRPENALTGTIFTVNCCTYDIEVPAAEGKMRFWRNTSIASLAAGQTATLANDTLGYEWDEDLDNGSRPPGAFPVSSTTVDVPERILDQGSTYGPGQATHSLTLYRHGSGALVFGAGTIQWPWGLDAEHDRGGPPADPRMQQATVNLFADMGAQPSTLAPGLVPASQSTDTTRPVAQIGTPAAGEDLQVNQQLQISGTASDQGGRVAAVEVSVDGGGTWHRATGRESWTYGWTPQQIGPANIRVRAVDDSGNLQAAGPGTNVDIVAGAGGCPCTIWDDNVSPQTDSDTGAVELGVKFRADEAGFITGLRFYKGTGNGGTHVGHLWSAGGNLLATATFTNETAGGWQQVALGQPVPVSAGTTYIASYHAPQGHYSGTNGGLTAAVDNPPLHALADGQDGGNGVYNYGPAGGFPDQTWQASNYWVDVVFTTQTGPDTTAPTVSATTPTTGAVGIQTGTDVTATFHEAMSAATIGSSTFQLRTGGGQLVPATVSYDAASRRATLDPTQPLANSATYTATVKGGAAGVADTAGNPLAADRVWSFSTAAPAPPPPDQGPGGPILVIASGSDPLSRYYAEILRAEGMNEFTVANLGTVSAATLAAYDVVVLAPNALSAAQAQMLTDWVTGGGNLIAMRPDSRLAGLLGLAGPGGTLGDAYVRVETAAPPGAGITGETMQFHGTADRYGLAGASTIATLYSSSTAATTNPAVTMRSVGTNGGQAAAFTYDLARSIVYTRQGNPAWAGQERDGFPPIRSDDLFFGGAQPDWVDLSKVAIPQADEQQRLLTNLIGEMNADRKPLPRFWYFPRSEKAVVIMTGDDHAGGGTAARFNEFRAASPSNCSVVNWECVRATSYLYPNSPMTNAQAVAAEADGFEVALHASSNCSNWTPASLAANFDQQLGQFAANYPGVPAPATNRTHCIAWSDWASQPQVELDRGIRLDTNYYYWPGSWVADRPGMFTGSGMPMRFAATDGAMIDVYQATTQMTDESAQSYPATIDALLDRALGATGYYGAFTANMHTDADQSSGATAIVASALARGVPVVSARQMLNWLDGRNASEFDSITWSGDRLGFTIAVGAGATGLRAMVPTDSAAGELTEVRRGGIPISTTTETIKGVEYAFFDAIPGAYEAAYTPDTTPPPVISGTSAAVGTGGTATITWQTDRPADSRVSYGTSPTSLNQTAQSPGLVSSHSVQLSGLTPGTTYHYRVSSTDAGGRSSTSPPVGQSPLSFSTPAEPVTGTLTDTTAAEFGGGQLGGATYVAQTADGEVTLRPTIGEEFSGAAPPSGWTVNRWTPPAGSATVSAGALAVDGASIGPTGTVASGRRLEFSATFGNANYEHAGFGVDFNTQPQWAIFSTRSGGGLYARTNRGGSQQETLLAAGLVGSRHRYRIDWSATAVSYYVDGALVATHSGTFGATAMRPLASDYLAGGAALQLDWLRMSPYGSPGTFDSRVLDAGSQVSWNALTWSAAANGGSLALSVRTGNTPAPDGSWSAFSPIASSGADIPGTSRYLQYRATLGSSDPAATPELGSVSAAFTTAGP